MAANISHISSNTTDRNHHHYHRDHSNTDASTNISCNNNNNINHNNSNNNITINHTNYVSFPYSIVRRAFHETCSILPRMLIMTNDKWRRSSCCSCDNRDNGSEQINAFTCYCNNHHVTSSTKRNSERDVIICGFDTTLAYLQFD